MLAVPRKEPRMILNHFPNLGQSAVCFSFSPVLASINLQSHTELQSLTTFLRSMKVCLAWAAAALSTLSSDECLLLLRTPWLVYHTPARKAAKVLL